MGRNMLKYTDRYPLRLRRIRRSLIVGTVTSKFPGGRMDVGAGIGGTGKIVITEAAPNWATSSVITINILAITTPTALVTGAVAIPANSTQAAIAALVNTAINALTGVDSTVGTVSGDASAAAVNIVLTTPGDTMVSGSAAITVGAYTQP